MKAAALRHAKQGGSFIKIPHDSQPVNEFFNPSMFLMLYPTLFPYGIGGFEDRHRPVPIGLENHVKHMLALADRCFQEHYSFTFVVFNVLQWRKLLLHTSLRVSRNNFDSWVQRFARISTEAISSLTERASNGVQPTAMTDDECLALPLLLSWLEESGAFTKAGIPWDTTPWKPPWTDTISNLNPLAEPFDPSPFCNFLTGTGCHYPA